MNGRPVEWNGKELELQVGASRTRASAIRRRLRAESARGRRAGQRRRDRPAGRSSDHRVDHEYGPRGCRAGRPRSRRAELHRRCPLQGLRRPRGLSRGGALVSGDGLEPRDGSDRALRLGAQTSRRSSTDFVKARTFYDYNDHSRVGAAHGEFVTDEICDRFCVIGSADTCRAKLASLAAVGVDQFNVYLMTHDQEETLAAYGSEIIPSFAAAAS